MSGSANEKVSIVITNYNALSWLRGCLESLRRQTHQNHEVIFVDNNSRDGSVAFVEQHFPEVRIIRNARDEGFASGNNIGVRAATGEFVLLLNTDTTAPETFLSDILQAFRDIPRLGCAQPKLYFLHDPRKLDSCGSYFTWTGFLRHIGNQQRSDLPEYNRAFPVFTVKGACMMLRKDLLEKTGGLFDDDYYCYFEETDFCARVWLAGYECWYYPSAHIHHAMGGATQHLPNAFTQYHSFKNRLTTYVKNMSAGTLLRLLPSYLFLNILVSITFLCALRPGSALSVYRALWYNLRHLSSTLRKRVGIQRHVRKVPDRVFLSKVTGRIEFRQVLRYGLYLLTYEFLKWRPGEVTTDATIAERVLVGIKRRLRGRG